ncbi:MAG: tetraacyldisaccharide 4-kinase [Burkholderiaceae bacterium]|nr:tetraacyldisaccharide 4-kinase [Burkholderiaceae bacterium]
MPNQPAKLESTLMRLWLRRGLAACLLWPLSLLFRAITAVRRTLYRTGLLASSRLPVPVIVVGNIFVGGTGKTPFVIWLVEALREAGFTPGVISRGHGAKAERPHEVTATSRPDEVGDEPLLIAQRAHCPVMVGRDRAAAGLALLVAHPAVDVIISDDGLQHYALQREIEIVLCDQRGNGNGWMLPAGPLREPASRRRDFTVMNAAALPPSGLPPPADKIFQMQLVGDIAERMPERTHRVPLAHLPAISHGAPHRPATLAAAAGIGNPARFFSMLRAAGLRFAELPLPDHFDYKTSPFSNIEADIVLITEKDAVKCALFELPENIRRLWVVPVTARIDAALARQIMEMLREQRAA